MTFNILKNSKNHTIHNNLTRGSLFGGSLFSFPSWGWMLIVIFSTLPLSHKIVAQQIVWAEKAGMVTFQTQHISDKSFGAGFTHYNAVWPIMKEYPGAKDFQTALGGYWLNPQRTETDPDYYHTIEGGLGWWGDT